MDGWAADLVKRILMSGRAGDRQLSDGSIQLDVWAKYLAQPGAVSTLLLTPHKSMSSASVARSLYTTLGPSGTDMPGYWHWREAIAQPGLLATRREPPLITPLQGVVSCQVDIVDFLHVILPMTGFDALAEVGELLDLVGSFERTSGRDDDAKVSLRKIWRFWLRHEHDLAPRLRLAVLIAVILCMTDDRSEFRHYAFFRAPWFSDTAEFPDIDRGATVRAFLKAERRKPSNQIWRVALDRPLTTAMTSIETIKADAAHRVFDISCREIVWAIIDSGVDGAHPAFLDHAASNGQSRVLKAYDFTGLRWLMSYDALLDGAYSDEFHPLVSQKLGLDADEAEIWLEKLRSNALLGLPLDWEALSALIEVAPNQLPRDPAGKALPHGTHVAGVLGGDWRENGTAVFRGVCPDIKIYDLRIMGPTPGDSEFAAIAALEFIRWLNGRNNYVAIHGANLSIAIPQDLEIEACGHSKICSACTETVNSGVTVVTAAGNWGAERRLPHGGSSYMGYATVSIADPGNTEAVITVGSTHREHPHRYGVSFFSSRGPTGDGRAKPDVVAPGEKIDGPLPDLGFGRLDGTSMAAPHVSGVAAMLMARYPELVRNPAMIKRVIKDTATDLGRTRDFQGAGLVDALRALQSI